MIRLRNLVQQLSSENYEQLLSEFKASNNKLLVGILTHYRTKLYSDDKMAEEFRISKSLFIELKRSLRRKIYNLFQIDCNDVKYNLLNRVSYLSTRPSNFNTDEENLILLTLVDNLKKQGLEYAAADVYEKLTQLNRDNGKYEYFYRLYRMHYNIKQSNERCLTLFMHLNGKIGEYTEDKCKEYLSQIDRTFLEIKHIHTYNKNLFTEAVYNMSLLGMSLLVPDSRFSPVKNNAVEDTYINTLKSLSLLPAGSEQFYFHNIVKILSVKMQDLVLQSSEITNLCYNLGREVAQTGFYNFNFSKSIEKEVVETVKAQQNATEETPKGILISMHDKYIKNGYSLGYYKNSKTINSLINRSTAFN